MPSNFRSNSQLPPLKRSCVSVAAIGSSQSGMSVAEAIGSEENTLAPCGDSLTGFSCRLRNGSVGVSFRHAELNLRVGIRNVRRLSCAAGLGQRPGAAAVQCSLQLPGRL